MNQPNQKFTVRDKLLRDTFTGAETQLFFQIVITSLVSFWLAEPRSAWALGFFMIAGGLCLFVLKTHEQTHPYFIDLLWPRFWLYSAPIWWLILQFTAGLLQNPISIIEIGTQSFKTLDIVDTWRPTNLMNSVTWISLLGFCSLYLIALNLYLVPKSQAFFEKLLPCLCFSAVLVALFGYLQKAFNLPAPLFTKGTGQTDFFSFFPYDGHWAAFALIWCSVCTSLALLTSRYDNSPEFLKSVSPWYLTGTVLLGYSGFLVEARWPSAILLLWFSGMLLLVGVNYATNTKERHAKGIAVVSGLFACLVFASALFRLFKVDSLPNSKQALHRAALEMFKDNPIFGWGFDSFEQLAPFYVDDALLGAKHGSASSDVLQFLAEIGIVGIAVPVVILILIIFPYLKRKSDVPMTNHMIIGCAGIVAMACVDSPLMSPAVFLSFFVVLFSALRWAALSRTRVDEVDTATRPNVVTPEATRNIPFFTDDYKETEK